MKAQQTYPFTPHKFTHQKRHHIITDIPIPDPERVRCQKDVENTEERILLRLMGIAINILRYERRTRNKPNYYRGNLPMRI